MNKKLIILFLMSVFLFSCGNGEDETDNGYEIAVLIDLGPVDDRSFNQGSWEGAKEYGEKNGITHKYYKVPDKDLTSYMNTVELAVTGGAKLIVTPGYMFEPVVYKAQDMYTNINFILIDGTPQDGTYSNYKTADNTIAILYAEEEAGFLAGALAASVTTSDMEYANKDAVIGFVGAKDTAAVINDSAVGYIEGAQFINPDIKVMVSYVGSYVDSATAKELALTQYSSGADCVFVAAGPASSGVIEAAAEKQKYVIGVDSDQALAYEGEEEANYIISSAIKGVGTTIYNSIERDLAGELPYGTYEQLGLADGAVGLADNDIYQSVVPETIRQSVKDVEKKLLDGDVQVDTAYGMDEATLKQIINSAQ